MPYTFSRRAFFKYSAAAAVAVAGMSLLGGCGSTGDPNNPYSTVVDSSLNTLDVAATLHKEGTDVEKGVFTITVENGRGNPLILSPTNFTVSVFEAQDKVDDKKNETIPETTPKYYSLNHGDVVFSNLTKSVLQKGESVKFTIKAPGFPAEIKQGETVMLKYIPITTSVYAGNSMSWRITKEAEDFNNAK